jgi:hypothetical protein
MPDTGQVMFRHEYEHALETWLRRRFVYLCVAYFALGAFMLVFRTVALIAAARVEGTPDLTVAMFLATGLAAVSLAIIIVFYLRGRRDENRDDLLGTVSWMIVALGTASLTTRFVGEDLGLETITAIFFWHFTACLFLPWTPRDSLRPIVPLLFVWAVFMIVIETAGSPLNRFLSVMFSPAVLMPGLLISGWRLRRHSREFRSVMLGRHYRTMRQEFSRARTIHESMFPAEYDDGFVRFQYTYEPMRELGGDFLHINVGPEGLVHLTVLDVTGHGLAAALTVNRLYGEIERIRGEKPKATPGDVMTLLNRYIYLTMANHNIYATGIAISLDPYAGEARWASGGHPPAMLRGANGVVSFLSSTAVMLGAVDDDQFTAGEQSIELSPGDVIVLYTDGAIEARDRVGRQFGIERLKTLLHSRPAPGNWPQYIASTVDKHKVGRAEDDVLVAALTFAAVRPQRQTAKPAMTRS